MPDHAPLRVTAVAVSSQLGGTERVLIDLARHAADLGLALRVLVPLDGPLLPLLARHDVATAIVPASDALLKSSQQRGRLWSVLPALAGLWKWSARLKRHEFFRSADLVYTTGFKSHLASALAHKRPLVWHLHEFPPTLTGPVWRVLARMLPDALIANSRTVSDRWAIGKATATTPITVRNGVDVEVFRPRPQSKWIHDRLGLEHNRKLIGMPAVLARWKGHLEVIEAFRSVQDECADTDLVIVGGTIYDTLSETRYGEELERVIRQHEAHTRVHLLPFQRDIERVYPELSLVLHYSLRSEPFGKVIVEAMASGVPVLAADEGGPREILGPQPAAGWLVEPRNPAALASAMRDVLQRPQSELDAAGAAGRARVESHYSSRRFASNLADTFRRIAGGMA
ncbi:MAG: glycosyltransferase family 4 protein [Gemmatimonadetes bacterium]|nr:glycosyltransferase family 4 protein [Gemmatimonadota bacterium]